MTMLGVVALLLSFPAFQCAADSVERVGPFFEPGFPFVQTAVELPPLARTRSEEKQIVVRGVLLTGPGKFCVLFDQELLRVAAIWPVANGKPPVELASMSQVSYAEPHRKAGNTLPTPCSEPLLITRPGPGAATDPTRLFLDPRPVQASTEFGRGPLPVGIGRFEGVEIVGGFARLRYAVAGVSIRETVEAGEATVVRRLEVGAHREPLYFALADGSGWVAEAGRAALNGLAVECKSAQIQFDDGGLVAVVAPSDAPQEVEISYAPSSSASKAPRSKRRAGMKPGARIWPQTLGSAGTLAVEERQGLVCDRIALPVANPWNRRIRPADIAFLSPDRAGVVTYDGDVWIVEGLADPALKKLRWRRYASGLNEPLSIAAPGGVLQVYTRNGLIRLTDRDGNGEADWYANFSDAWVQSSSNRAFPLDMAVGPDGSTYISQGGIGKGTPFAGAISRISPDGEKAEILSTRAREPYLALHPETGLLTSTDQQGNFIPSSVCYMVRPGANFGYGEDKPDRLTPPLVWIPHHEDNSSASQVWLAGRDFGAFTGKLLHLSYGRGVPLLVCPDLDAPVPQGAVISLGLSTGLPLLHARVHPEQPAVFACGFQIYDSRVAANWGLARIRLSNAPVTTPVDARSTADGVLITFAQPLDPASVSQESIFAASWNYRRSKEYGSGRFTRAGAAGTDPVPIGQVLLSEDRKTVFVHLPELAPVMQLGISHQFRFNTGAEAKGDIYFTIHQLRSQDLQASGFAAVDLSRSVPVVRMPKSEPPTRERGKVLSVQMGCVACHSTDGSTEGKTGPTWKGLFGKDRFFADGSMESANEYYIRASILEPEKKIVAGYHAGMASYQGVLAEDQIDSIILYIRSLR
jgi:cytochrome c2